MAIDREATLKNAEKFLRVGRLDAAIAEYARVVEDQPRDWNSANTLGDLCIRAGQLDRAVGLYRGIAEHFLAEGFYPKAAAIFKKILKTAPDDERAQLRLAEISATQGLMADAKAYYTAIANRRRQRGDVAGADEIVVRLGTLDPDDLQAGLAAARASERSNQLGVAARQYRELYEALLAKGREAEALAALADCVRCDPDAAEPGVLLPLASMDLREGRLDAARVKLDRLLASGPAGRDGVINLARSLTSEHPAAAGLCVELAADALVASGDFATAAGLLDDLTTRVPGQVPILLKLVELCVDAGIEKVMYEAQARLADAYLASGQAAEARVIAEDLVTRQSGDPASVARLRSALEMLQVEGIDAVIAEHTSRSQSADPTEALDDVPADPPAPVTAPAPTTPAPAPVASAAPSAAAPVAHPAPPAPVPVAPVGHSAPPGPTTTASAPVAPPAPVPPAPPSTAPSAEPELRMPAEIDLTALLSELEGQSVAPEPAPRRPQELDEVFAGLRSDAAADQGEDEGGEYLALAGTYLEMGMPQEAIGALEMAARSPVHRFAAASMLAQMHRDASDLTRAIEWLERASEVPAPNPADGHAVLYDLGDVLETIGETGRALAVFLELDADAPGYRDVAARVTRLAKVETEG